MFWLRGRDERRSCDEGGHLPTFIVHSAGNGAPPQLAQQGTSTFSRKQVATAGSPRYHHRRNQPAEAPFPCGQLGIVRSRYETGHGTLEAEVERAHPAHLAGWKPALRGLATALTSLEHLCYYAGVIQYW